MAFLVYRFKFDLLSLAEDLFSCFFYYYNASSFNISFAYFWKAQRKYPLFKAYFHPETFKTFKIVYCLVLTEDQAKWGGYIFINLLVTMWKIKRGAVSLDPFKSFSSSSSSIFLNSELSEMFCPIGFLLISCWPSPFVLPKMFSQFVTGSVFF